MSKNKIKIAWIGFAGTVAAALIAAATGLFSSKGGPSQKTHGDCSPIVNNTTGNTEVICR
ncbi:MAG: hypothetical protein OEZ39_01650 [Gammaproteobacteria bacterium]|nr:hypothetical protein [Gammaproteobacteria bacterium]MDH5650557.1 hypothetical protein [Gammaproteobacteria bacterium]